MDAVTLLASIDPMQAIMGSLWMFAAGMFPLGFMLGSPCSPCCNTCESCESGSLPDTLTVTFDGLQDQTQGPDLISLSFSSCFGGGASARVTAPAGDPVTDKGPITAVSITNAGSGYAKLGRVAPTITASGAGTGAGLTVVLSSSKDACNVDYWSVSSVTVSGGGTGYTDGEPVTFTESTGDSFEAGASATINTVRVEPTVEATVFSYGGGNGAALAATLTQGTDFNGRDVWSVSGITIDDGGTGYAEYDFVSVTATDGTDQGFFYGFVSSVDGNGAITGIDIYGGGEYYKATDEVESVTVTGGGIYYREDADEPPYVAAVTVTINQTLPSDGTLAELTATVEDDPDSENFGKIVAIAITNGGDDYLAWQWLNTPCCGWYWNQKPIVLKRALLPSYLGYDQQCVYEHRMCGGWNLYNAKGSVHLVYRGPSQPPLLVIDTEITNTSDPGATLCNLTLVGNENITDCGQGWQSITFVKSGGGTATATVLPGGEYDPEYKTGNCHACCQGEGDVPNEITVTVTDTSDVKQYLGDRSGTYVLSRSGWYLYPTLEWGFGQFQGAQYPYGPGALNFGIGVSLSLCDCNECLKKCQQTHMVGYGYSGPDGGFMWPGGTGFDTRTVAADPDTGNCTATDPCVVCVESTPTCRPSALTTSHKWCFGDRALDFYPVWFTMEVEE